MVENVLDARALVKRFGDVHAVNDVRVSVAPGERVGFLGPNGAGKTTTLLMLLGAISPDSGTISLCGHRLPGGRSKAMEHVGFAAGYLPLPERLRVKEALGVFAGLKYMVHSAGIIETPVCRRPLATLTPEIKNPDGGSVLWVFALGE